MSRSLIIAATVLGLTLAGCAASPAPADSEMDESATGGDASGGSALADCALGSTWSADIEDMASQLYDMYHDTGIMVESVTGDGEQLLHWSDDGLVSLETDYIFTVVNPMPDGPVMTMIQVHQGTVTGYLDIVDDQAVPSDWDSSAYLVNTTLYIDGTEVEGGDVPVPEAGFSADVPMAVTCDGDRMTTFPEGAFITQTWSRVSG